MRDDTGTQTKQQKRPVIRGTLAFTRIGVGGVVRGCLIRRQGLTLSRKTCHWLLSLLIRINQAYIFISHLYCNRRAYAFGNFCHSTIINLTNLI